MKTIVSTRVTRPPVCRGFTLIEILVVIVIIAILAALLFPVTGMVRANSECTKCLGHMQQLAAAVQLYANDNDGKLVYVKNDNKKTGYFTMWYWSLSPYLSGPEVGNNGSPVYTCPTYARLVRSNALSPSEMQGFQVWQYGIGLNFAPTLTSRGFSVNAFSSDSSGARGGSQVDYSILGMPRSQDADKGLRKKDIPLFADAPDFQVRFPQATDACANWHGGHKKADGTWERGSFNVMFLDYHAEKLSSTMAPKLFPP